MRNEKVIAYSHEDRQWDCRINVQEESYLADIVENIMLEAANGKFKYILIGGVEIGTKPNHSDYKIKHVHVAAIFHNRASKSSIIKNWGIIEGNGYYLVPRDRSLPYSGWKKHHIKEFSKIDTGKLQLFENGELPADKGHGIVKRSDEEKKKKLDDILLEINEMLQNNIDEDEIFKKYPSAWNRHGAQMKTRLIQTKNFFGDIRDPHLWLFGLPGTGKSALLDFVYPNAYQKDLNDKFMDKYDPRVHHFTLLPDLDHENVKKLGIQYIKTLCDEKGFNVNQKYKPIDISRTRVLVTSNYTIDEIVPADTVGIELAKKSLYRRFLHVRIDHLLRLLGIKLISKYEINMLKKEGNEDPSKLFMSWDYVKDEPDGLPLLLPEDYREIIREYYYGQADKKYKKRKATTEEVDSNKKQCS